MLSLSECRWGKVIVSKGNGLLVSLSAISVGTEQGRSFDTHSTSFLMLSWTCVVPPVYAAVADDDPAVREV